MNWFPRLSSTLKLIASLFLSSWCFAADEPGAGEWTTFGNGPAHTGFYPKTIGAAPFVAGWTKSFSIPVNLVAVSGDAVYATTGFSFTDARAFALNVADGSEKWSFPLAQLTPMSPPTYAEGRLYFQSDSHSGDTYLYCLDAASGTLIWAAPDSTQGDLDACTVANGQVIVSGGSYSGLYSFDAITGVRRFVTRPGRQESGCTPSFVDGVIYRCVSGSFTAIDPTNGGELWTRDLRTTSTPFWESGDVPVISAGKATIVGGGRIVTLDLATRTPLWSLTGNYSGVPATAGGVVYAILGSEVKAFDAITGAAVGTFSGMGTDALVGQPLLTADRLIVSNGTRTFIFDRATFTKLQTLENGGALTYAAGTLYIISQPYNAPSTLATYRVAASEPDPAPDPLPPPQPIQSRPNPDRTLGPATATWLDAVRVGGIWYFLFDQPAKIERYDLASGTWLKPISLPDGPKAFAVSSEAIFMSFGKSVSKFSLDGATETPLINLAGEARLLFAANGRLYLLDQGSPNVTVLDLATRRPLQVKNLTSWPIGIAVTSTQDKFFGRRNSSPGDILETAINADGTIGTQRDSPYHGNYPSGTRAFLFPGEARVIDNAGIVYSTSDLTFVGSLAGAFDDIDFSGDAPVVLRNGNLLVAYSTALGETGRKTIAGTHSRISIDGAFVILFGFQTGRGVVEARNVPQRTRADPTRPDD